MPRPFTVRPLLAALAAAPLLIPAAARANPEASPYDSRSIAVGLTGVAWLERPSALAINPANLQGVDDFTLSLSATGIFAHQYAPVEGPDTLLHAPGFGPVGAIFGAGRIHERVVLGLGVYLDAGYGAKFEDVTRVDGQAAPHDPQELEVTFFQGEAALGASVRVLEDARWGLLDVGLALRLPFASQQSDTYQETLPPDYSRTEQNAFGVGLPGARLGLTWRPSSDVSFGVSYRSKTRTTLHGAVRTSFVGTSLEALFPQPLEVDVESDWFSPHMLHVGGAFWFLERDLMLTLEYRVQFHEEANQEQVVKLDKDSADFGPGVDPGLQELVLSQLPEEVVAPFLWQNVHSFRVGVEGWLAEDQVALRGGYNIARSATTEEGAQYFTPPHGWSSALYAGLGFELGTFAIDLASAFTWAENTVEEAGAYCQPGVQAKVGCPGTYRTRTWWLSATVTYQL